MYQVNKRKGYRQQGHSRVQMMRGSEEKFTKIFLAFLLLSDGRHDASAVFSLHTQRSLKPEEGKTLAFR